MRGVLVRFCCEKCGAALDLFETAEAEHIGCPARVRGKRAPRYQLSPGPAAPGTSRAGGKS